MSTVEQNQQSNHLEQLLYTLGHAYLERHQYKEALDKFLQIIEIGVQDPAVYQEAATAAIGLEDVSQEALSVFQQAVQHNPESTDLKIALANLFTRKNITSPFAIQLCEEIVNLPNKNNWEIYAFLRRHYASPNGESQTPEMPDGALFSTKNNSAIRAYLEDLIWQEKFDKALSFVENAKAYNNCNGRFDIELALIFAYQLLKNNETAREMKLIRALTRGLQRIHPAESIQALCNYLTIRLSLPDKRPAPPRNKTGVDEYEFILGTVPVDQYFRQFTDREKPNNATFGKFDLQNDILAALEKPPDDREEQTPAHCWNSVLLVEIVDYGSRGSLTGVLDLIRDQLRSQPQSLLRQAGTGFLCLAQDPIRQIDATIQLLQHLEHHNSDVDACERVGVLAAMTIVPVSDTGCQRKSLAALVETAHLLRRARSQALTSEGYGVFLLHGSVKTLKNCTLNGVSLIPLNGPHGFPGQSGTAAEVIWRNPLDFIKEQDQYYIGQCLLRRRLQRFKSHASYLGTNSPLGYPVILKIMQPQNSIKYIRDEEKLNNLYERIRSIGRLNHPNIGTLFDMGQHDRMLYFAREYIEGRNLTEMTFDNATWELELTHILITIVKALQYAHTHGIHHLNLKPRNIWIGDFQKLKIVDFHFQDLVSQSGPLHRCYLAPELQRNQQAGDVRSDIYSLGIVAYELLAGVHPYASVGHIRAPEDIFKAHFAPLAKAKKPHHTLWDSVVMKAIKCDPDQRFESFAEIELELKQVQIDLQRKSPERAEKDQ